MSSTRHRPNIQNIVRAFVEQIQNAEDTARDLFLFLSIETATGDNLDSIGEIVNVERTSLDDTIFRQDILFQIYLNNSSGQPDVIIQAVRDLLDASQVYYSELWPAKVRLHAIVDSTPTIDFQDKMKKIVPAGVDFQLTFTYYGDKVFIVDEIDNPLEGGGFSELDFTGTDDFSGRIAELYS